MNLDSDWIFVVCSTTLIVTFDTSCVSFISERELNTLPDDKIYDLSKLEAFADDNSNMAQMLGFVKEMVENVVGNGKHAGHQHFFLYPKCLLKILLAKLWDSSMKESLIKKMFFIYRHPGLSCYLKEYLFIRRFCLVTVLICKEKIKERKKKYANYTDDIFVGTTVNGPVYDETLGYISENVVN